MKICIYLNKITIFFIIFTSNNLFCAEAKTSCHESIYLKTAKELEVAFNTINGFKLTEFEEMPAKKLSKLVSDFDKIYDLAFKLSKKIPNYDESTDMQVLKFIIKTVNEEKPFWRRYNTITV